MVNNKVEEIMKNYRQDIKKIDSKYRVKDLKKLDTRELDENILKQNDFIIKLETQGKSYLEKSENQDEKIKNDILVRNAKLKLDAMLKEKQEKIEKFEKEKEDIENSVVRINELKKSKVILPSGREVLQTEKDNMDKLELAEKARRELIAESKNISNLLIEKSQKIKENRQQYWAISEKLLAMNNEKKAELENDEEKQKYLKEKEELLIERNKLDIKDNDIRKEMSELSKIQESCQKYLEEFEQKDKNSVKGINDILKETYGKEEKSVKNENTQKEAKKSEKPNEKENSSKEGTEVSGNFDIKDLDKKIMEETNKEENSFTNADENSNQNLNEKSNENSNENSNQIDNSNESKNSGRISVKPEIIISRKPRILRNNYNIGIGKIKKLIRQKPEKIMSKLEKTLPGLNQEEIEKISKDMDPILLEGIMELRNKNILTEREIKETIQKISDGKATMEDMNFKVVYDMGDLSKGAFWPWNRKDRDKIAQLAEENKEQGIAEFKDGKEYEPDPIKRMLKRVQTKKLGEGTKDKKQGIIKRFFKQFDIEKPEDKLEEEKTEKPKNKFKKSIKENAVKDEYHKITDEIINSKNEEELANVLNNAKSALNNKKITTAELASIVSSIKTQKGRLLKEQDSKEQEKNINKEVHEEQK